MFHNSVDICPLITMCALDIICETSMGTKLNAQQQTTHPYAIAIGRSFSEMRGKLDKYLCFIKNCRFAYKFLNIFFHTQALLPKWPFNGPFNRGCGMISSISICPTRSDQVWIQSEGIFKSIS